MSSNKLPLDYKKLREKIAEHLENLDHFDDLLSMIEALKNLRDDDKPEIFKTTGRRIHQ